MALQIQQQKCWKALAKNEPCVHACKKLFDSHMTLIPNFPFTHHPHPFFIDLDTLSREIYHSNSERCPFARDGTVCGK